MNPSSISNSNTRSRFPRPTKPAVLALAMLLSVRIAFLALPIDRMTRVDSRVLLNLFKADLFCELREKNDPEVLILGTSRTLGIGPKRLERPLNLPSGSVLNLSRPGADFFFLETILRRHPDVLQGLKVLLIDVVPFQARPIRGEFFLRYASLKQRLIHPQVGAKAIGVLDFLIPAISHPQDPFQWRMGIQQFDETLPDRLERLRGFPLAELDGFVETEAFLADALKKGTRGDAITDLYFGNPLLAPNAMNSLHNIIDLVPDDCRVILVWLPFRDDIREIIEQSPRKSASRKNFREFLESIDDPKVELHWFEEAREIKVRQNEYNADGCHFAPMGMRKVARALTKLARPHLKKERVDRVSTTP